MRRLHSIPWPDPAPPPQVATTRASSFLSFHFIKNRVELIECVVYKLLPIIASYVWLDAQLATYSVRQLFKLVRTNHILVNLGVNLHKHLNRAEYAAKQRQARIRDRYQVLLKKGLRRHCEQTIDPR